LLAFSYTEAEASEQGVAGMSKSLENVNMSEVKSIFNIMYTTSNVNLRSKPSIDSEIYTTIKKRTIVFYNCSLDDGWAEVKYEGQIGYVKEKYLTDKEPSTDLEFTDKEIKMLQRITEAECQGQSIESKENVASCIINRMLADKFSDTIRGVIFQESQFSPIEDGNYYSVTITEDTITAVNNVIKNGVTHDCLYFCNYDKVTSSKLRKWFDSLVFVFKDDANHSYYNETDGE
jgi:hypothetical protein